MPPFALVLNYHLQQLNQRNQNQNKMHQPLMQPHKHRQHNLHPLKQDPDQNLHLNTQPSEQHNHTYMHKQETSYWAWIPHHIDCEGLETLGLGLILHTKRHHRLALGVKI